MSDSTCEAHTTLLLDGGKRHFAEPAGLDGTWALRTRGPAGEPAYRETLHRCLAGSPAREIDFFVNAARFDLMRNTMGDVMSRPRLSILNVASGPFAFEFYAAPLGARIRSFDRDARLETLHDELVGRGLIAPAGFSVGDVTDFQPSSQYDLVLVNDLFYAPALDFFRLIGPLAAAVAPGGTIYFDVQDERAGPIWSALGKGGLTSRYVLAEVRRAIEAEGFAVTAVVPSLGIKGGLDGALRRALWIGLGIANNFAFVARRMP